MENSTKDKLRRYELGDSILMTGFGNYENAINYANEHNGEIVEAAFTDGNDNPVISNSKGLIENKIHFLVEAGPEYKFIHSSDPGFREYADEIQKVKSDMVGFSPEEKYLSNAELEIAEDPIIVLKNEHFESVTSRERCKYLKQANVYEIGVKVAK